VRPFANGQENQKKEIIPAKQYEDTKTEYEYFCQKKDLIWRTFDQDFRFRKRQIEQIEASLERMAASLEIAKQKLEDLTIKAPVAGHLTSLNAEIGESKKRWAMGLSGRQIQRIRRKEKNQSR